MNEIGYTKSFRSKWENPVFRNKMEAAIWAWMCDVAAWKPTRERFNGITVELERGQLVASIRSIAEDFGLGEQVTRTFLENIKKDGMVNTVTTHKATIITICNYDKYQSNENADNTLTNNDLTHTQHTANTLYNKAEEVKKGRTKEVSTPQVSKMPFSEIPFEWRVWVINEKGWDDSVIEDVWSIFRDYWQTGKGKTTKRQDWGPTWRSWCRKDNSGQKTNGAHYAKPTKIDLISQGIAEARAKREQREQRQNTTHNAREEISDFQKIYDAGSAVFPVLASANTSSIQQWISAGCIAELDAIPEIKRHSGKQIKAWSYFTGGIMDAKATRETPPPKGTPHAIPSRYSTPTKTDRLRAAAIRAAQAGGYAPPGQSGQANADLDALSVFPGFEVVRQGT